MSSPARARSDRKRAAILAAAAHAIARDGYHGMSMRDLSRATGSGLASFYVHFASKEDILFALQSEAFDGLIATARTAVDAASDPAARLHAFILNHVRFFTREPDLMRALVQEAGALPPEKRALVRDRKEQYFAIARDILETIGRKAPRELERETYALFGMLNWMCGWYDPARHGSPEDVARTFHRVALCGMADGAGAGAAAAAAGGVT